MKTATPEEYAATRRKKLAAARQKRYRDNHPDKIREYEASRRKPKVPDRGDTL